MTVQEIEALISSLNGIIADDRTFISKMKGKAASIEKQFDSVNFQYSSAYAAYTADKENREKYDVYSTLYQELVDLKNQHDSCYKRIEEMNKIINNEKLNLNKLNDMLKAAKAQSQQSSN